MASHGQTRAWFAEFGAPTSPPGATAPRLAGPQVGVTAGRPDEILTDDINDMLTSPHHGPMSVIDHRGVETGSRKVDYDYALVLPDSRPKLRASAFDALLSAA